MIIYTNKNGKICWKPVLLKSFLGLMLIVSLFGLLSFQPSRKPRDNHQVERTKLIKEIQIESPVNLNQTNITNEISNSSINGRWKSTKMHGFDQYLKELGVSSFKRRFGLFAIHSLSILNNGSSWYIIFKSRLAIGVTISSAINCTDGEEFDYTSPDGSKYKTTIRGVGARKFIQEDRDPKNKTIKSIAITEVNENDELVAILKAGNATCIVTYARE